MKKIVAFLLCLIMILSLFSCKTYDDQEDLSSNEKGGSFDVNEAETAMKMYEAAIKGEICVFDERLEETKLESLRLPSSDTSLGERKLLKKAMIDVNQDGISEFVIKSPDQEYIILRYYNGKVYSYLLDDCEFYRFNKDGSFHWYDPAEADGWECGFDKITFEGEKLSIKPIYSIQHSKDPTNYKYFVEGKAVTGNEYDSYRHDNIRYERMEFSQFEISCSYPINAEQAWNLANAYWDNQDGASDCGAGTTWTARIELVEAPNPETDNYRFAFLHESTSNGGGEGDECMPPYNVRTMDQILVNAFTGEVVASTYDPNIKCVSADEAIEIVKDYRTVTEGEECNEENGYSVTHVTDIPAPDHVYVIVIQKHETVRNRIWIDKYMGKPISSYYLWGK